MKEFELETARDYLERSRSDRRRAIEKWGGEKLSRPASASRLAQGAGWRSETTAAVMAWTPVRMEGSASG